MSDHKHEFAVDASCECGIRLSTLVHSQRADQGDWRKGVALIASALGYNSTDLCCVAIADLALNLRAEVERLTHERDDALCDAWDRADMVPGLAHRQLEEAMSTMIEKLSKAEAEGVVPVSHVCGGGAYCPVCQAALRDGGAG